MRSIRSPYISRHFIRKLFFWQKRLSFHFWMCFAYYQMTLGRERWMKSLWLGLKKVWFLAKEQISNSASNLFRTWNPKHFTAELLTPLGYCIHHCFATDTHSSFWFISVKPDQLDCPSITEVLSFLSKWCPAVSSVTLRGTDEHQSWHL